MQRIADFCYRREAIDGAKIPIRAASDAVKRYDIWLDAIAE